MATEPGIRRRLPAGVVDSGFASLATFVVGITAVNLLGDVDRGVYAVFFTAFLVGTLPPFVVYTPVEVEAVGLPVSERLGLIRGSLRLGLGPSLIGMLGSAFAFLVTSGYAALDVAVVLALTSALTIVLSPMQDHVRRMLHIASHSWTAASVSVVQFTVTVVAVIAGTVLEVPAAWIPFGVLATANAVSLTYGVIVGVRLTAARPVLPLRFRQLAASGRFLLVNEAVPALTGLLIAAVIPLLASPEELGYAESARVVAQPVLVLAAGLSAVLSPRAMRAAMDRDRATARHTSRVYVGAMILAGAGYLVVVGWDWPLNPMAVIVPSAYALSGLVALTVIANLVATMLFLQNSELMGARRERTLAKIAALTSPLSLAGGLTAGFTGAYARAIGVLAGAGVRYVVQWRALGSIDWGSGRSEGEGSRHSTADPKDDQAHTD